MARPGKNEEKQSRDKVFSCALDLFIKYGYEGTSMRMLAGALGVRQPAIYHYFPEKEALLEEIYQRMDRFLAASIPSPGQLESMIADTSPYDFFETLFASYSKRHDDLANRMALFLMKEDLHNQRARDYVLEKNCHQMAAFFIKVLERYQEAGKIRKDADCCLIAHALNYHHLGMLTEWIHVCREGQDDTYLLERLSRFIHFIFDQICQR